MLSSFVVQVGLGWLALIVGIDYGFVFERRVPAQRLLAGVALTLLCALGVGCAVAFTALFALQFALRDALLLALALGAMACETTRHAVRWVTLRHGAEGPVADLCADLADASEVVPLLLLAVFFRDGSHGWSRDSDSCLGGRHSEPCRRRRARRPDRRPGATRA